MPLKTSTFLFCSVLLHCWCPTKQLLGQRHNSASSYPAMTVTWLCSPPLTDCRSLLLLTLFHTTQNIFFSQPLIFPLPPTSPTAFELILLWQRSRGHKFDLKWYEGKEQTQRAVSSHMLHEKYVENRSHSPLWKDQASLLETYSRNGSQRSQRNILCSTLAQNYLVMLGKANQTIKSNM